MLIEEIKNIKSDKKEIRKFGITIGIVLLLISAYLFYVESSAYIILASIAAAFILLAFVIPSILKPLQIIWMTIAVLLGFVMTRVILSVLFYLIVTPIGLIARLSGKDFLDRKIEREKKSYWNYREIKGYEKIDTERQF
ncbi:MAG: hypothetical protein K9J16_11430 [Melioribacteraceae bacterium]|nr:hypothetical protein [Melioribacteraceae bacterium]MCF8395181.1 hypothetical protein [Melioribacteraceae bacterium]MCF8420025.1 hypothetical protein [Melioribacteraceae bacterium]